LLLLVTAFLPFSNGLKFLCYSPRFASSHVNFMGKLTDSLISAGHEVVVLSPTLDPTVKIGSAKARLIEIPQTDDQFEIGMNENVTAWQLGATWEIIGDWSSFAPLWLAQCRAEQFDAAFTETIDWCSVGIFYLTGIDRFAVTESFAHKDGVYQFSQTESNLAYVPTIMGGHFGEEMTLAQRTYNVFNYFVYKWYVYHAVDGYNKIFDEFHPGFPDVAELMSRNSLYFLNSDPLVDFPRPSTARVIDIGGIAISNGPKKLNTTWSSILDLRRHTVLLSFGTLAKTHSMPEEYKETIRATARAMPDVTFIWKYEKPEHNVTQGVANLIESTWVPQNDLLHDKRLSLFVTHCGQGSTTEANYAGVPVMVVPVILDQVRNAYAMKRAGVGLIVEKSQLASIDPFRSSIKQVLDDPRSVLYRIVSGQCVSKLRYNSLQIFVRNMEFLAMHGPLRMLDHHGRNLTFVQYYLIDVISLISCSFVFICASIVAIV
ncbi:hypothetical protein PFISCL1PPCAC_5190, partial [Pristionchus fissidentatus]